MSDDKLDRVVFSYTTESSKQIEEENQILRETVGKLDSELKRLKSPALMVCEVHSILQSGKQAIIKIPNGNTFLSNVASDCGDLEVSDSVLVEQKNLNIVRKVPMVKRFNVEQFVIMEKPRESWADIGGLSKEIQEIKEVIELPLLKPELFEKIGIKPAKGLLLYGPPGTGKTLMAKAAAHSTNATFIQVVGSELVQKFIGEGAKLVKEIFQLAREKAPSIIFIDEIDALAATRMEMGTSGEREVSRTFMQLLAEIDGFSHLDSVKVIGATNRKDILDPAIVRPGRLDRLIHVDVPSEEERLHVLKIHAKPMRLSKNVNLEKINSSMDDFTGAEIRATCTEAGYFAIRSNRATVNKDDFKKAVEKVRITEEEEGDDYLNMFG